MHSARGARRFLEDGRRDDVAARGQQLLDDDGDGVAELASRERHLLEQLTQPVQHGRDELDDPVQEDAFWLGLQSWRRVE